MRTETTCKCPKCGYKFWDITDVPMIPFEDDEPDSTEDDDHVFKIKDSKARQEILEYLEKRQKAIDEGKMCKQHIQWLENGKCKYCEEEKEMNR